MFIMQTDVIEFINKFKALHPQEIEDCFLHGNCYWFAFILAERFDGEIWYLPIDNHFITYIGLKFYDISGEVKVAADEPHYRWKYYRLIEPFESYRIQRDCIDKRQLS